MKVRNQTLVNWTVDMVDIVDNWIDGDGHGRGGHGHAGHGQLDIVPQVIDESGVNIFS